MEPVSSFKPIVLVRYGELAIKSHRVRARMVKILESNMRDALNRAGIGEYSIYQAWGRVMVEVPEDKLDKAAFALSRVFGVVSTSPTLSIRFEGLRDIAVAAHGLWAGRVKDRTFAVRVSREGEHPFKSIDVARIVGSMLYPYSSGVDLERPEVELYIEVRGDRAYFFERIYEGPGGLPLGSQPGRLLALVSGGFDSPVAYWLMSRRGALVDALFCSLAPPADLMAFSRVFRALYENWIFGYDPTVYIADCSILTRELRARVNEHLMNVVFKRMLYKLAEGIAIKEGYLGIVTGESLGQVSSQTLMNLYSTSLNLNVPIFRPLIGMDKDDIVKLAKRIGTYEESSKMVEACSIFSRRPRTSVKPEELEAEFNKVKDLLNSIRVRAVKASELGQGSLASVGNVGCVGS